VSGRRTRALALALLTVSGPAMAAADTPAGPVSRPVDAFQAANEAYGRGDHATAIAGYEAVLAVAPHPDAYFNLGTALADAGELGRAVWALEEARALAPSDDDVAHNLEAVRQRALRLGLEVGGELKVILPGDDDVGTGLLTALSPRALTLGFGLTWVSLFGLLIALRRGRRETADDTRRTVLTLAAVTAGLGALAFGGLLAGRALVLREAEYAVVVAKSCAVQHGPGDQYRPVARIVAGVKLRTRGEEAGWQNVVLPDGGSGWVEAKHLAALRTP
jgi:tetratricopeptide (TPR) repeat protein